MRGKRSEMGDADGMRSGLKPVDRLPIKPRLLAELSLRQVTLRPQPADAPAEGAQKLVSF